MCCQLVRRTKPVRDTACSHKVCSFAYFAEASCRPFACEARERGAHGRAAHANDNSLRKNKPGDTPGDRRNAVKPKFVLPFHLPWSLCPMAAAAFTASAVSITFALATSRAALRTAS